ncbi:uncharacterized protein HaLaN_12118 [Haematococcus lacustris]|uniref:Uncharacterized protein n=1 Tax=Haematococcus lacustris TaxID=44745 RepID=A0A699YZT9_HAELA|nr:uncharacterized protein HaLaN_12118 [Haematococcus lacustris]
MGAAATATFSNATLKMSKFQMAQVYAASIMFGYFLRRVDKRFQLEKALGSLRAAVGKDASSMEEVMERMAKAVESDAVETLLMTVATQRRAVLEAVAFGTFLRDVESWVDQEYSLLTPLPAPRLPPGRG